MQSDTRSMVSVDENYDLLKQELLRLSNYFTSEDIDELVRDYEHVIASKRRSSNINSIDELVSVLEKRCHISAEDPSQLSRIVNRLPNRHRERMESMLTRVNFQWTNESNQSTNNLGTERLSAHRESPSYYHSRRLALPSSVVERISEEIGFKWRDLARALDLRQGDINAIETQHPRNFRKCALEVLRLYESKYHKEDLRENLLKALEKARRRDLRDSVQYLIINANT